MFFASGNSFPFDLVCVKLVGNCCDLARREFVWNVRESSDISG